MTRVYKISEFEVFDDAAEEFHPHIKFYATFNPKVSTDKWVLSDVYSNSLEVGDGQKTKTKLKEAKCIYKETVIIY